MYPVHRLVQLIWNKTNVYYYKSTFVGKYSEFYYPDDKPWGCEHEDDFSYIFNVPRNTPIFHIDDPENIMIERMTRFWANFVKTG